MDPAQSHEGDEAGRRATMFVTIDEAKKMAGYHGAGRTTDVITEPRMKRTLLGRTVPLGAINFNGALANGEFGLIL